MDDTAVADTAPAQDTAPPAPETTPAPAATSPETASAPEKEPAGDTKPATPEKGKQPDTKPADDTLADLPALSVEERRQYAAELAKLDPDARKVFNALLTQKSQRAAEAEKRAKVLKADLDAARQAIPPKSNGKADEDFTAALAEHLPSEAKALAPALAPVLKGVLESELTPVTEYIRQQQTAALEAQGRQLLADFEAKHPDYREFEPRMLELGTVVLRGDGVDPLDYLSHLYVLASAEKKQQDASRQVANAKTERAETVLKKAEASAAAAEPQREAVSPARVVARRTGPVTMAEAFAAAQRGEIIED